MPDPTTVHVLISGRVQGVGYRACLRAQAQAAGLCGWVRNLSDGRVEAVLHGSPQAIEAALAWCRSGPPGARVDAVHASPTTPEAPDGFEIRRDG